MAAIGHVTTAAVCYAGLLLALSTFKQKFLSECHRRRVASPANLSQFDEPKIVLLG